MSGTKLAELENRLREMDHVLALGGHVSAQSKLGHGSIFQIILPASGPEDTRQLRLRAEANA